MFTKEHHVRDVAQEQLSDLLSRKIDNEKIAEKALSENEAIAPEIAKLAEFVRLYDSFLVAGKSSGGLVVHPKDRLLAATCQGIDAPKVSVKASVINLVAEHLQTSSPQKTNALLQYLKTNGVEVPGANKAVYLANILSTSNRFVARRKHGGWFLIEHDPTPKEESPSDTNTEAFNFQPSPVAGRN